MEKRRQQLIFRHYTLVVERLVLAGEIKNHSERRAEIENILKRAVSTVVEPSRNSFAPTDHPPGAERPKFIHRPPRADGTKETALEFFNRVWADAAKAGEIDGPALMKRDATLYARLTKERDAEGRSLLSTVVTPGKRGPKPADAEEREQARQRKLTGQRVRQWKKRSPLLG